MKNIKRISKYFLSIPIVFGLAMLLITVLHFEQRIMVGEAEKVTEGSFYDISEIDSAVYSPGELLRAERLESAPENTIGWRVLYRSTDKDNNAIVASGLIAAPITKQSDKRLPIVSWGHPTTGVAKRCAPSVGIDPFDSIEGLRSLIASGHTVVAADYSGMGVDGPPSFLIGKSEAHTMIDIVRASQQINDINRTNEFVTWGHSQGGHAALFTSEIAATYAPELTLKGVAVAAPATNLQSLMKSDIDKISGVTIGSYIFHEYNKAYDADLTTVLSLAARQTLNETSHLCLLGQNAQIHKVTQPLIGNFLIVDPTTVEPWATILIENTPTGPPLTTPLFIAQGEKDQLINPEITATFAKEQKARGVNVTYVTIPNAGHGLVAIDATHDLIGWFKGIE